MTTRPEIGENGDAPERYTISENMLPLVYEELRRLAAGYLRRERPEHTLQATAVVHEAYMRLMEQTSVEWGDRTHFTAQVAHMMRQILVDHAREREILNPGGDRERIALAEAEALGLTGGRQYDLVELDDALLSLEKVDARKSRIVELHFFGGLTLDEIADVVGGSRTEVKREWWRARAWLFKELM